MTNLCRGLLFQVVLLLCIGSVHTFKCKQRCKIGIDSCPVGKVCTLQADKSERCEDKPAKDTPEMCMPKLVNGEVEECLLGPLDNCVTGSKFTTYDGVNTTILNADKCSESIVNFSGLGCSFGCFIVDEACFYIWEDNQSICTFYGKNCELRVTRASSGKFTNRNCV